jgi:Na+-translocating ferredoxin:NAD+ oxidoreductase RnfG subunit
MFAFKKKNRINNDEIKEVLYKSMFNSSVHSKIIRQSAKKSSEDQKKMIKQYDELKEIVSC